MYCIFWYQLLVIFVCNRPSLFFQTCKDTQDISSLTRAADFVKAFILGFQVEVSTLMGSFSEQCIL